MRKASGFAPKTGKHLLTALFADKGISVGDYPFRVDDPVGFAAGDGDIAINLSAFWAIRNPEMMGVGGQLSISPIVVSERELEGFPLSRCGSERHKFVRVNKGSLTRGLAVSVAYYATLLKYNFPALDPERILSHVKAECDYWLAVSPASESESITLQSVMNENRASFSASPVTKQLKFFFVDAIAAFGTHSSLETPIYGFGQMLLEDKELSHKPLSWVSKHPTGIEKGFLEDNWDIWTRAYGRRIVPDHPISIPMHRFLSKRDPDLLGQAKPTTSMLDFRSARPAE